MAVADVFISYARVERSEAETVKARLEAMGLSVFLDVDGLDGGDVFSEKLDREVKSAGIVLGLWSPTSLSRPWVQIECDIGKRRGVLIPVAIRPFRDMDVPAPFWNIQFVDLTEGLHNPEDPNWIKLHRSIARTLNRPAPATQPAPQHGSGAPDWMRASSKRPSKATKQNGAGALLIVLGLVVMLAGAGGAFIYFDPMKLGLMAQIVPAAAADAGLPNGKAALGEMPVSTGPATTMTGPNPLADRVVGKWAPSGLTCSDALSITSSSDQLVLDYGGSPVTETIEGAEPDGALRTRGNSGSFFYSISDSTLTLRSAAGAVATFSRCGG